MSALPARAAVRTRVERMTSVMTIPTVVTKVLTLVDSGKSTAHDIAEALSYDQVLAAKVLKLVNSGVYGIRQPITTLSRATVLLGQDVIKTLVLSSSVLGVIDKMNLLGGLWEHSVATARAASLLSERIGLRKPEEVALSALLHDVGKVVLAQAFPAQMVRVQELVVERRCLMIEAEQEVFGVGHPEVASWLLKRWALPEELTAPIAHHNNFHPSRDFADRTAIVHVADVIARAKGIGNPGDPRIPPINPDAWKLLNLSVDDLAPICRSIEAAVPAAP
jgi:putative nucleotidyltransferase with HDIG domain